MNDKIPIVHPQAKKFVKSSKNRQIVTENPFLNENNENNDVLLKDNTQIPQITREDFHVAGWQGRSKIPSSQRKTSPQKKEIPNNSLSIQGEESLSEPEYGKKKRVLSDFRKTSYKKHNEALDDSSVDIVPNENEGMLDILRITSVKGECEKKQVPKAESARDLPRPKYYSTLKPLQKNSLDVHEESNLGVSQVVMPKDPEGRNRSPRKTIKKPKISVRKEIEQKYDSEINPLDKDKPFYELFRRKEILVGIARTFFPDSQTDEEAIINLINHNSDCSELNEVCFALKNEESKNRDLLLAPFRNSKLKYNAKQQREAESLVNEIFKSRKQIGKLRLCTASNLEITMSMTDSTFANTFENSRRIYNPQEDMGYEKIDQQVSYTKEKNFVRALSQEVERLEKELASVEKRIKLMTQGKSNYGFHANRITDQYGKQQIDIPRLGEDNEEDMIDTGIFKMTVTKYEDFDDEMEDKIEDNEK